MKFLFCPLASAGFVFPSIAIARALEARGHEVAFVTGIEYQPILEHAGLTRIPRGTKDGPSFQVPTWFKPLSVVLQYRHIEYALEHFRPDVLVTSVLSLGPLFVRELFDIPCAVLGFLPYIWPTGDDPEEPITELQKRRRWRHQDMLRYLNESRQLFKMDPLEASPAESPFLADLFLQRSIPALEKNIEALPGRVHQIGACLWEPSQADSELEAWLENARAAGQPVLYVQQGRSFDSPAFWPHLIEALSGRHERLAASVARMDVPTGELPSHWFVRPLVPQASVMSMARAVIASGNTTVTLGAITHGLPSVLISGGSEQPDVAEMLEAAGAARHMRARDVSAAHMSQLMDELSRNKSLRERARVLQRAFAEVDGPQRAADLLEQLASERGPVLRIAG